MTSLRAIAHLDLDCFYAQVEHRRLNIGESPWTTLESPPLAVIQWDGLIAVNYSARQAGVRRGMPRKEALELCPKMHLVHVETLDSSCPDDDAREDAPPVAHDERAAGFPNRQRQKACLRRYREASSEIFTILARHASRCERASIDEAYLDLTEEANRWLATLGADAATRLQSIAASCTCASNLSVDTQHDASLLAAYALVESLRAEVQAETGFTVSAGIAGSKQCAKLASACFKPNRQTLVPRHGVNDFMASIPIKSLRGLGGKLGDEVKRTFSLDSDTTCAALMEISQGDLQRHLGEKAGAFVWRLCRGLDNEEVKSNLVPKQYLSFKSFQPVIEKLENLEPWIVSLSKELADRVKADSSRVPKTLVLHHRGRLNSNHAQAWTQGRTADLTKTINRSYPFPTGNVTASSLAAAARRVLLDKIESPFPCSRLAIGATDFMEKPSTLGINALFQRQRTSQVCAKPCGDAAEQLVACLDSDPDAGASADALPSESSTPVLDKDLHCASINASDEGQLEKSCVIEDAETEVDDSDGEITHMDVDQGSSEPKANLLHQHARRLETNVTMESSSDRVGNSLAIGTKHDNIALGLDESHSRKSGGNAGQVANFHKSSRLHFLGTWRERFDQWRRSYGNDASVISDRARAALQQYCDVAASSNRDVVNETLMWAHLDMDCFFASVATRDIDGGATTPSAVVSSLSASGELCSCNYAARSHGVNTHLWSVQRGREVLPSLNLIPISEALLREVEAAWQQVYHLLVFACAGEAGRVHMRSCDEAFIEIQDADALSWAEALRKAVHVQTQCTCSIGIGPSQVIAKLAGKACKPNGAKLVVSSDVRSFMAEIPLTSLPQVGRSMSAKLEHRGLTSCEDVWILPKGTLQGWFGKKGEMLWSWAQGEDAGDVLRPLQRKTMSAEINFGVRLRDKEGRHKLLTEVAQQLADRLSNADLFATQLTIKVKVAVVGWTEPPKRGGHGRCDDYSKSIALPSSGVRDVPSLLRHAASLLDQVSAAADTTRIRGVGLSARVLDHQSCPSSVPKGPTLQELWSQSKRVPTRQSSSPKVNREAKARDASRSRSPIRKAHIMDQNHKSLSSDIIDLDHCGDSLGSDDLRAPSAVALTCPSRVACPVCGMLQDSTQIDAHVNAHFDVPAPQTSADVDTKAQVQARKPPSKSILSLFRAAAQTKPEDSVCEILD